MFLDEERDENVEPVDILENVSFNTIVSLNAIHQKKKLHFWKVDMPIMF